MKPAEVRLTLILLAVVFGVSVSLLAGKAFLYNTTPAPAIAAEPAVTANPTDAAEPLITTEPTEPVADAPVAVEPVAPVAVTPPEPSVSESPVTRSNPVGSAVTPVTKTSAPAVNPAVTATKPAVSAVKTTASATTVTSSATKPAVSTKPAAATATKPVTASSASARTTAATSSSAATTSIASRSVSRAPGEKALRSKKGTLVFVFDDAGHNLEQLKPYLALPFPCTIAVLPGLRYSHEAARMIRAAGKDVILHQPMQAINRSMDPGPGAITADMNADQIKALVRKNLAEVWPVVGINNHEGSLVTADRAAMEAVLDVAREKGIYFLDSRTNADTVAPIVARERNMTIWERSVFLDNSQEKADILEALSGGMKVAEKKGSAIMIGHIWSNDLANILTSMYPELVSQGFSLSTIAEIATNGEFDE